MKTIKLFVWFTVNSKSYMKNTKGFYTGFIPAWKRFYKLNKADW